MQPQGQQQLVRRSPPPKFRPFMIIIVVLSLGLVFIGLTLTIIAHWPGYTAIGFNPLKIVGPVLLAVGGVVFIGCIAEVIRKSQSDKKNFTRQMQERERMMSFINRTAHSNPASSQYSVPTMHHQHPAQRGILKSSGSQYAGSQYGADSGVGHSSGANTNMSYEPDSQGSPGQGGRYEVHMNPNGGYAQVNGRQQGYSGNQQGYSPTPQQGYQPPSPLQGQAYAPQAQGYSSQGQGYEPQSQGYNPQGQGYNPQGYTPQSQGYPGGQGEGYNPPGPIYDDPNELNPSADIPQPVRPRTRDTKKKATADPQYNHGFEADRADVNSTDSHNSSLVRADIHMAPNPPTDEPQDRDTKRRRRAERKRQKEEAAVQQAAGGTEPLHINIRAGAGVNVTITPQGTPVMDRHNASETSI